MKAKLHSEKKIYACPCDQWWGFSILSIGNRMVVCGISYDRDAPDTHMFTTYGKFGAVKKLTEDHFDRFKPPLVVEDWKIK